MEIIESFVNNSGEIVNSYQFKPFTKDNVNNFLALIFSADIRVGLYMFTGERDGDHFIRSHPSIDEAAYTFSDENNILSDIGFVCLYNGSSFTVNFNLDESVVTTFTAGNINLEPLLGELEQFLVQTKVPPTPSIHNT